MAKLLKAAILFACVTTGGVTNCIQGHESAIETEQRQRFLATDPNPVPDPYPYHHGFFNPNSDSGVVFGPPKGPTGLTGTELDEDE